MIMRRFLITLLLLFSVCPMSFSAEPEQQPPEGFTALFDGKSWDGDLAVWSVQDGAITGHTTADTKLKEDNFLVWKDQVENFELRLN
jgi:hypothetical protein